MRFLKLTIIVLLACVDPARAGEALDGLAGSIPLRGDFPTTMERAPDEAIPVSGGVPFPKGALRSTDHLRLVGAKGQEILCQISKTAVWPDGSIKWVLLDAVLKPEDALSMTLQFGPAIRRAQIADPLTSKMDGDNAIISGGGVYARISKTGGGVLDECRLGGRSLVTTGKPARLVLNTLRIADGTSGIALPTNHFSCRDSQATLDIGKVQLDEVMIESPGPIRATVLVRGVVLLPTFGATLPGPVKQREPPGRLPFSMRLSFHRGSGVVAGQHQIVFSGEPDCDFIVRWGIELPGQASDRGQLILEPGVEMDVTPGGAQSVAKEQTRLCWSPLQGGCALIREGWQNRPCAITHQAGAAWIDFWPEAAGVWDLRRYAREWAVGESGDMRKPEHMRLFAKYAARGMAKSHQFTLYSGSSDLKGPAPALVRALSGRALIVAQPAWYAASEALGKFVPEQTSGAYASLDATFRRRLDYYLFSQDLFGWYGKLTYGFFQSRYGEIHRNDRWDNDYGRWGWALNDGAGRFGHILMLQFLRTLDRRYFVAGEAFNRISYDTNMVHTEQHLENCTNWWTAKGCSHRHNVQPFGCPYVGMRGSYPVGHRMVHLLTGDGVFADGLDLVADAAFKYANGASSRLCNSGGSDGQGSAAHALLWKFETSGEVKYLEACRKILDLSGLVPPAEPKRLGYGPAFGLFNAACEYADLSEDRAFQERVVQTGRIGADQKSPNAFLFVMAKAAHLAKDGALAEKIRDTLTALGEQWQGSLAELPRNQWPGHGGASTPAMDALVARDLAYAMAAVPGIAIGDGWPKAAADVKAGTAAAPADWFRPGGEQTTGEKPPSASELAALKPGTGGRTLTSGKASFVLGTDTLCTSVDIGGASPLAAGIVPYAELFTTKQPDGPVPHSYAIIKGTTDSIGPVGNAIVATSRAGSARFVVRMRAAEADGVPSVRVELACLIPSGRERIASFGLLVPLKLGAKANMIQTTAPGRFRLERCRLDQNDEKVESWLSAMEGREQLPHWPRWRESGLQIGPGTSYRIWRASAVDVSPTFCDQGEGPGTWFDVTDRGVTPRWGLTARILRSASAMGEASRQAIRVNLETGLMEIQFHDAAAAPLSETAGPTGVAGSVDLIFHDGWRPPLAKPELTPAQYEKFIDDLGYGQTYGLNALRFKLSTTHMVQGRQWMEQIRDLGIEPREILHGMQARNGLAEFCQRIGVAWNQQDPEGSIRAIIAHYRK